MKQEEFKKGLPLVIFGTIECEELPFWSWFRFKYKYDRKNLNVSVLNSAFSKDWSKHRIFYLFFNFRMPNDKEIEKAKVYAKGRQNWPHDNSVFIKDDIMVVILKKV